MRISESDSARTWRIDERLTVKKLDSIMIEWIILAIDDCSFPTWAFNEGYEGHDLPFLCFAFWIRFRFLFLSYLTLALATLCQRRKRECVQTFALLDGCYGLFIVTIHEPAVKVIRFLLVVSLVVRVSQHIVSSLL